MTKLNFRQIRVHAGSQNEGFEELTAQLFYLANQQPDAEWIRKRGSGGDGGVEAYWRLPDGSEHCLQSKYIFELGSSQRSQISRSVEQMLNRHPECTRYIIAIPFNLTDARSGKGKSQRDHWENLVKKWHKLEPGRDIEFVLWDETQLNLLLMRDEPEYSGRRKYWFDSTFLSQDWMRSRHDEALSNLGDRYTPELHVDLPLFNRFQAAVRGTEFWDSLESVPEGPKPSAQHPKLKEIEAEIIARGAEYREHITRAVETRSLSDSLALARESARAAEAAAVQKIGEDGWPEDLFEGRERSLYVNLRNDAAEFSSHLTETYVDMAEAAALFLTGAAGSGKSHLLADVTSKALDSGAPAVLVLGQQFQSDLPWPFVLSALDIDSTADEFLGALDAAGQARGCRAILAIDALNEGRGTSLWPDTLSGFAKKVARFPNVVLIASCRDTYNKRILKNVRDDQFLHVYHSGFQGHEEAAAKAFLDKQNISRPDAPFLDPEFSNPLFLKTICAAVKRKGETKFPKGLRGVTAIFDYYISSIADAIETRLNLDPDLRLVRAALGALQDEMLDTQLAYVPKLRAYQIVENTLASNGDAERNLIYQLKSEGVLSDDIVYPSDGASEGIEVVRLSYERLLDHLRAERFIKDHVTPEKPEAAFQLGGHFYAELGERVHEHAGFLDALSIQMPEQFKRELFELIEFDDEGQTFGLKRILRDGFKESVCWRDPAKTNDDTLKLLNEICGGLSDDGFEILMRCATDPDHAFNAHFLHNNLFKLDMIKRDKKWTEWVVRQWYSPEEGQDTTPVWRIIDWAMSVDVSALKREQKVLAAIALSWLFTAPNRSLRDRATKALSRLLDHDVNTTRLLLLHFDGVDDDYVLSRVYAAAYAVALRVDSEDIRPLARTVVNRVFRSANAYGHILTQDSICGILQVASRHDAMPTNFSISAIDFSAHVKWPIDTVSPSEAEALKEQLGQVYWSVMSGDFGKYTMGKVFDFSTTPVGHKTMITSAQEWDDFLQNLGASNPDAPSLVIEQKEAQLAIREHESKAPGRFLIMDVDGGTQSRVSTGENYDVEAHKAAQTHLDDIEKRLKAILTDSQEDKWRWLSGMRMSHDRPAIFSRRVAKRWILKRIADMGFVQADFEDFERYYARSDGRSVHSNERMGKKYQWIAFHHLLASLAAMVRYTSVWEQEDSFEGVWQINARDIDPSLIALPEQFKVPKGGYWWAAKLERLDEELSEAQGAEWVREVDSLPDNFEGLEAVDPSTGREFLVLDTFVAAQGRRSGYNPNNRQCNQSITSVVVRREDAEPLINAMQSRNMAGELQNPRAYSADAFLLEYPWHPAWTPLADSFEPLHVRHSAGIKVKVHYPYRPYTHENSGYDRSMDRSITINLPSEKLISDLGLHFDHDRLTFVSSIGDPIFYDPGMPYSSASSAVIDKSSMSEWLTQNELVLISSVTLMKQYNMAHHDAFVGELTDCQLVTFDGQTRAGKRWSILTELGPTDSMLREPFEI